MIEKNARMVLGKACVAWLGCALLVSATGCFLPPAPPSNANDGASAAPVEAGLVNDVVGSPDPVVPEPIRNVGNEVVDVPPPAAEPAITNDAPIQESADLNADGVIDATDVNLFGAAFGSTGNQDAPPAADLDGDGAVTLVDFQILLTLADPQVAQ